MRQRLEIRCIVSCFDKNISIAMKPEVAKKLFFEGGVLIFLDVPAGTEFGVDLKSWNVGEKFRGLKMIPPGLHFIYYNAVDKDNSIQFRSGFFHDFKGGEILVKKWDKDLENINQEVVPDAEIANFRQNVLLFDEFLGPYPYDILDKWKSLTSNLSVQMVNKLTPTCGLIKAAPELVLNKSVNEPSCSSSSVRHTKLEEVEKNLLPNLVEEESSKLRLTTIPSRHFPENSTPAQITMHSLDSTYVLEMIMSHHERAMDVLGELEFCYVCFLIGQNFQAFEQWKNLFGILCSSEAAIQKYSDLYISFLSLVEIQIQDVPEDFFVDIVENNNFIYTKLRNLFANLLNPNVRQDLQTKAIKVKDVITNKFSWRFDHLESDDEDEAPVIVSM